MNLKQQSGLNSNKNEDQIKNEGGRVATTIYIDFSEA